MVGHIGQTKPGAPIFKVDNMKNVYIDESQPLLDRTKLRLAINAPPGNTTNIRPPKRTGGYDNKQEIDDKKVWI